MKKCWKVIVGNISIIFVQISAVILMAKLYNEGFALETWALTLIMFMDGVLYQNYKLKQRKN